MLRVLHSVCIKEGLRSWQIYMYNSVLQRMKPIRTSDNERARMLGTPYYYRHSVSQPHDELNRQMRLHRRTSKNNRPPFMQTSLCAVSGMASTIQKYIQIYVRIDKLRLHLKLNSKRQNGGFESFGGCCVLSVYTTAVYIAPYISQTENNIRTQE